MIWLDCGNGTLHSATGFAVNTNVVELKDFGRIFEVYHYGNDPEGTQRLIVAAPELLEALQAYVTQLEESVLTLGWRLPI
jgi:hypothetical protein